MAVAEHSKTFLFVVAVAAVATVGLIWVIDMTLRHQQERLQGHR